MFYFNNFIIISFFLSFLLCFLLSHVADWVLVLWPSIRLVPLRQESLVQDIGPQETSNLQITQNENKYGKTNFNDTLNKMDFIDIYRTFHSKAEYTFLSSAHGTFSRRDHVLGHKSSLGKFKKIEIISSIFSDHNAMRLVINYRKKICKKYKHMEAKQYITK